MKQIAVGFIGLLIMATPAKAIDLLCGGVPITINTNTMELFFDGSRVTNVKENDSSFYGGWEDKSDSSKGTMISINRFTGEITWFEYKDKIPNGGFKIKNWIFKDIFCKKHSVQDRLF